MQRLDDGSWVISPSDVSSYSQCPWGLALLADSKLGKPVTITDISDPMMELVQHLGLEHEQRTLEKLKKSLALVVEIPYDRAPAGSGADAWRQAIQRANDATLVALHSEADALFQATFYQHQLPGTDLPIGFQGFADFIVRQGALWEVWDTKLARRAKDPALLQLAAYADQLHHRGIATSPEVRLILGDGTSSVHLVDDLMPSYLAAREEVVGVVQDRIADPLVVAWGSERYPACGSQSCGACHDAVIVNDDLFQIAGIRKTQREKFHTAGFLTMVELGGATTQEVQKAVRGIGEDTLVALHRQARLQVASRSHPTSQPAWEVISRSLLKNLPAASPGDLFFDFEGDPTYQEWDESGEALSDGGPGGPPRFGLEYLFGVWGLRVNPDGENPDFLPLWAENFGEEKIVLEKFCTLVESRRQSYPDLHVYHYAPYERTKLKLLATRHETHQYWVARLLNHVLVDLYPLVTKSVAIGVPSYGLKALEALYFEPGVRTGITGGGESVVAFAKYREMKHAGDAQAAKLLKNSILHYNEIDCLSTLTLRNWLLGL